MTTLAGGLLAGASSCFAVGGKPVVLVALATPEPPHHVVAPAPDPPPVAPPAPVDSATAAPPAAAPPARSTPPVTTAKPPEHPPASPPVVAAAPAPADPPAVLQTVADTADLERKIQAQLDSAERDLHRVDPSALNAQERAQYDMASQLYKQAYAALKLKQYNFAYTQSDKAARMASLLAKRRSTSSSVS